MKIILFGHQNWGIKAVETINQTNHDLVHVYTHPLDMDKNEKVWYDSLTQVCKKLGIAVTEQNFVSDLDVEKIKQMNPDLIISAGWRRLIPSSISTIPKYGSINMHEGFLPSYRGFAPVNWAIINGEKEIAITIHYIDATADTGDIILQKKIPIQLEETAKNVYDKALTLAPELLLKTLENIQSNKAKNINQKTLEKGFFCSRRYPKDGKIFWDNTRTSIYNLIRALSDPYPNAFCFFKSQKIFIKNAKLIQDDYRGQPGRICSITDDGMIVTCGIDHTKNQAILITQIEINDKIYKPKDFFKKLWEDLE